MHHQTHARVIKVFNRLAMLVGFPILLFLLFWFEFKHILEKSSTLVGLLGLLPALGWLAAWVLLYVILWSLPVRCSSYGCHDSLTMKTSTDSNNKEKIEYRCEICGAVFEVQI